MCAQTGIQRQTGHIYGDAFQTPQASPVASGHLLLRMFRHVVRNPVIQIPGMIEDALRAGQQKSAPRIRGEQGSDMGTAGKVIFPVMVDFDNAARRQGRRSIGIGIFPCRSHCLREKLKACRILFGLDLIGQNRYDTFHIHVLQHPKDGRGVMIRMAVAGKYEDRLSCLQGRQISLIIIKQIITHLCLCQDAAVINVRNFHKGFTSL